MGAGEDYSRGCKEREGMLVRRGCVEKEGGWRRRRESEAHIKGISGLLHFANVVRPHKALLKFDTGIAPSQAAE